MGGVGHAAVHERARRVAGGGGALGQQAHLHGLGGPAEALGAGLLAVLGPAHPSEVGGVHAVPHVVGLGGLAGEPQAHGLKRQAAAGGAAAALRPALPAQVGDVAAGLHGALRRLGAQLHPERLHPQAAAGGAGHRALAHGRHPALVLDVGGVGD